MEIYGWGGVKYMGLYWRGPKKYRGAALYLYIYNMLNNYSTM